MKEKNLEGYDLIGDIHGHAEWLIELLQTLGYQHSSTGFYHPRRKVIFVGDFIDRGEHLAQHRQLMQIVMSMVDHGHALAVMGNHEFNALAFHTRHKGQPLRPHTERNIHQHRAFLNEFAGDPEFLQTVLAFFWRLPLWLQLQDIHVIHACWHPQHMATIAPLTEAGRLTLPLLIEASTKGTPAYDAIEVLLKGVEVKLPDNITIKDKDEVPRSTVRVQWWNQTATRLADMTLPENLPFEAIQHLPRPEGLPDLSAFNKPCFIGHYWRKGDPELLHPKLACLDYSAAAEHKLVAYRWSGEQILSQQNFVFVD